MKSSENHFGASAPSGVRVCVCVCVQRIGHTFMTMIPRLVLRGLFKKKKKKKKEKKKNNKKKQT